MSRLARWAPGQVALRSARHLLWLLDHHARPTAGHTRPTTAGPVRGWRRPAAVQIATTGPPPRIEASQPAPDSPAGG